MCFTERERQQLEISDTVETKGLGMTAERRRKISEAKKRSHYRGQVPTTHLALEYLRAHIGAWSAMTVAAEIGRTRTTTQSALNKLVSRGEARRVHAGQYMAAPNTKPSSGCTPSDEAGLFGADEQTREDTQ